MRKGKLSERGACSFDEWVHTKARRAKEQGAKERIAERGRHGELLAKGGLYADLWMRQAAERELEAVVGER